MSEQTRMPDGFAHGGREAEPVVAQAGARDVAVVGMSAIFAGAPDLCHYWQNIIDKVDAVSEAPDAWAAPYFDATARRSDRIYTRRGGFLGDLIDFNPMQYGIMPNTVDGGDPDQYLALKLAAAALDDAGYRERDFDRERTAVILGRGTYVNRGYANVVQHGLVVDQTVGILRRMCPDLDADSLEALRAEMHQSLPPFNPEMLGGLVPNATTGRIANRLGLMGPNYIVDAACASSLIAVELGVRELMSGRCEMVLTGGVHASTPPQIYMIFCQLDALSRQDLRPFDAKASGTLLGEGAGILVLKRLADAKRDNDRIYAVIKGIGSSSDGKALGLLAPRLDGEVLALRRAYEAAGVDPRSVGLIEAHGTGISLGDQTEIGSLSAVFGGARDGLPRHALGSVKSMIGHCIPAAGAAGMVKTILALHHKVLPPTLCGEVNPALELDQRPFYVNTEPRPWIHGAETPRRAGVNAFGFGGVNAHVVFEEYDHGDEARSFYTRWPSELVVLSADGGAAVRTEAERLRDALTARPETPLAPLAFALARRAPRSHRLAVVARDAADLAGKLDQFVRRFDGSEGFRLQSRQGVAYAGGAVPGKTAFLFPGEGSQYQNMLAAACLHFPRVRAWFDFLDRTFDDSRGLLPGQVLFPPPTALGADERRALEAALFDMDVAAEVVFTASMALYDLLSDFGLRCDAMLGHSTGENTALVASGVLQFADGAALAGRVRALNGVYRALDAAGEIPRGVLLTVGAFDRARLERVLAGLAGSVHVAMDNCPNQVVLFGARDAVAKVAERVAADGAVCSELPFDRAYHTPMFEGVAQAFRRFYDTVPAGRGHVPVYSQVTAEPYPDDADGIRTLAARQWSSPVRFRDTIATLYAQGFRVFVEVGASASLTSFVDDILRGHPHVAVATDSRRRPGLEPLLGALGRLYANGADLALDKLFTGRRVEPADLDALLDGRAGAPAATPRQGLALAMPRIALSERTVERLRADRLAPDASPAPPRTAVAAPAMAPPPHQPGQDARLEAVRAHFALMDAFLDSQARVMGRFASAGGAPRMAAPAEAHAVADRGRFPLLGRVLERSDGGLRCERVFDLESDLFLRDHTLGGAVSARQPALAALPVIPFTFSMEMIAEAAVLLDGGARRVAAMRDLRGYRWLTLDDGEIRLSVHARRADRASADAVHVGIHQVPRSGAGEPVLVFEGRVELAEGFAAAPAPALAPARPWRASGIADAELYAAGMFHGPLLRGVTHLRRWSEDAIEADLEVLPVAPLFARAPAASFETDAGLLDAAGQLVGFWLFEQFGAERNCFPFRVTAFEQFAPPPEAGTRILCRAALRFLEETRIEAHFELIDAAGRVIARLEGWQDRTFRIPPLFYEVRLDPEAAFLSREWPVVPAGLICRRVDPLPDNFLDDGWAIWKRVLAHLVLSPAERRQWQALPESAERRTEWLLGRIAAKDALRQWAERRLGLRLAPADIEIRADAQGMPYAHSDFVAGAALPALSITHKCGHAVAIASEPGVAVGIDLERLDRVRAPDLLAGAFESGERKLIDAAPEDERDRLAVGFWAAKEAAAKARGSGLGGAPRNWPVVAWDRARAEVDIDNGGDRLRVSLAFADTEVFAVCDSAGAGPGAARGMTGAGAHHQHQQGTP